MRAIVQDMFGPPPGALEIRDIDEPAIKDNEVLVRIRASSGNAYTWDIPAPIRFIGRIATRAGMSRWRAAGLDLAGQVEAVGENATEFRIGDEVFGWCKGALAEYASVAEDALALKPSNLTFEQSAAIPVSGLTALQGLRDMGCVQTEQKVLIIGASGGVGTFAVQIAKSFGAEVTGVCGTDNLDLVRSIGADHVIDYKQSDFTECGQCYDLILDMASDRSLSDLRRVLSPQGTLVMVGGSGLSDPSYLKGFGRWFWALLLSAFSRQKLCALLQVRRKTDLVALKELVEAGNVMPVVSASYGLSDVPGEAKHLDTGHGRGKIAITM